MHAPRELGPQPPATELAFAVSERELLRLLQMPRGTKLEDQLRERAESARAWYAAHGRPFAAARRVALAALGAAEVRLEGHATLRSGALADELRACAGHAVAALAVSAGREVAAEVASLWRQERPDEAYFLDRFAAAVAEALLLWALARECRAASDAGETLLAPHSPGCGRFEIGDQHRLFELLGAAAAPAERTALGPIELLPSGALDPPHSLLAACAVTRRAVPALSPEQLCAGCELAPCAFRRASFVRPAGASTGPRLGHAGASGVVG